MKTRYNKPYAVYDVTDGINKQTFVKEFNGKSWALKFISQQPKEKQFVIYRIYTGGVLA